MKRFAMTDDLITGIEDIDEHHKMILELGNQVIVPSAVKAGGPLFDNALQFLANYVIYHFAAEEFVMMECAFPQYDHHRQWHDRFKHEVLGYVNQVTKEGMSQDIRLKVSFAMENWLIEHVRITDRALATFLQQKACVPIHLPAVRALKEAGRLPEDFSEQLPQAIGAIY